jgi:hypothetical protein
MPRGSRGRAIVEQIQMHGKREEEKRSLIAQLSLAWRAN